MDYSTHKPMTMLTLTHQQNMISIYELSCLAAYSKIKSYFEHVIVFEKRNNVSVWSKINLQFKIDMKS